MKHFILALAVSCVAFHGLAAAEELAETKSVELEALWKIDGFSDPEGVAIAPQGGYFVSNVAGGGTDKDGLGWISHIDADGTLLKEKFAEGFDAPKGMAVQGNVLHIADIDHVRTIDATTGETLGAIAIEGAEFLNDITVWQGMVFVSDSRTATIHKVGDGKATAWLTDERLGGVNGLLGDGDTLLISTMSSGSLFRTGMDKMLIEIATGMTDADGIGIVPSGGWLVSAWRGDIFYVAENGETSKLLDTRAEEILQNDLTMDGDLVIVPNWRPGTVTGWRVK